MTRKLRGVVVTFSSRFSTFSQVDGGRWVLILGHHLRFLYENESFYASPPDEQKNKDNHIQNYLILCITVLPPDKVP